ncbi:TRAP transporter small permease [Oricola thermophila]|uniref:TRAP transporter small permease protein n=1 Tax=Oricola thermophila TaxID=2742145 RepID=A0A6N1VF00_9HYPH|nr:TRAP transporter small permease [Oricola thermophila]QKV19113.1 TRAP transporter small permease [Oricola thermophila]
MTLFLKIADRLALAGAIIAGTCLCLLVVLDSAEIILRSFFSSSLSFVVEYNGYLLAMAFLGGTARTFREDGHIRVNMLIQQLPPPAARVLDIGCTIVGFGLSVYLCIAMCRLAYGSYAHDTLSFFPSRTPLAYPQAAVSVTLAILAVAVLARLVRLLANDEPAGAAITGEDGI